MHGGRAWYDRETNTIKIPRGSDPKEAAVAVFAELAHAQQAADRKKNPISKLANQIKFSVTDAIPAIATGDSTAGPGLTKYFQKDNTIGIEHQEPMNMMPMLTSNLNYIKKFLQLMFLTGHIQWNTITIFLV